MDKRISRLKSILADGECVLISSYPNIFYYSGFTSEDAYLLIGKSEALIITDSRYTVQAKTQCPGFRLVNISEGFYNIINTAKEQTILFEEKDISVGFYMNLKKNCPDKVFFPSQDRISSFRQKKEASEIAKIKAAEELGDAAFSYIIERIKAGMTEMEIAAEIEYFMRKNGAAGMSFETIAASGYRSSMPHGAASGKVIEKGELLTLDFGCVLDGYCSDMTRTVAIGHVGKREEEIYNLVLAAQNEALLKMEIGMKCKDIDALARQVIEKAGFGKKFGHSLGHSVGIEIHEAPNFSAKSPDIFEVGNVITVEPGIYIDGEFGVRIEDVVAATPEGIINITKSPKELITV